MTKVGQRTDNEPDYCHHCDELQEEVKYLQNQIKNLLEDTSLKSFAKRESERANNNGKRASMFEVENIKLRDALKEVMSWIDNWDPNFTYIDDEWPATKTKVIEVLK